MLASLNFPNENWSQVSSSSELLLISCVFFFLFKKIDVTIFIYVYVALSI